MELFTGYGLDYLFRWLHMLAGVTWIGLLYYFNFVQTEYFKEAEPDHKAGAIQKLVPRALWWFRWGAMVTFLSGVALLSYRHNVLTYAIVVGSLLATIMFLNVWLVIWPNQKIVVASAVQVADGGEALGEADRGARGHPSDKPRGAAEDVEGEARGGRGRGGVHGACPRLGVRVRGFDRDRGVGGSARRAGHNCGPPSK